MPGVRSEEPHPRGVLRPAPLRQVQEGSAAAYQAQSIPTLVFLERGTQVDRVVGAQPKPVLQQHIDELLAARG